MGKPIKMFLIFTTVVSMTACENGFLSSLSPARNIESKWEGTLTWSDNDVNQSHKVTDYMYLNIAQKENNIAGFMTVGSDQGTFEGTVNGVNIDFTATIGNGCINVHGTFTSTNMEGMKNSSPPPYLTCGDVLNDGWGSKGIEWHLYKK
jgi:hypothetical protein